jgi:hypothetical protein
MSRRSLAGALLLKNELAALGDFDSDFMFI